MLRESLLHGRQVQDWVAGWWKKLSVDDRRTLMALVGIDDSRENAIRPWEQYLQSDRDKILAECKRLQRLLSAVIWA